MELSQQLKELIDKQLPGLHANALKEYIEEAEKLKSIKIANEDFIKKLQKELAFETEIRKEAQNKLAKAESILQREKQLELDLKTLELDRLRYDIAKKMDELRVQQADVRANGIYTLVGLLVRNPEAITMLNTNTIKNYSSQFDPTEGRNVSKESNITTVGTESIKKDKQDPPSPGNLP